MKNGGIAEKEMIKLKPKQKTSKNREDWINPAIE